MSTMRKQKQLEALFMKILEQVRAFMGQIMEGRGETGHPIAKPGCLKSSDSKDKKL